MRVFIASNYSYYMSYEGLVMKLFNFLTILIFIIFSTASFSEQQNNQLIVIGAGIAGL